jgi:high-affinity iron transporter
MIPTFVIFLREGIEASMIVAILLAYLQRIGKRQHFRDVFSGVAAALVVTVGGGIAAFFLIRQYDGSNVQTYFETATYLLAAVILTYMTFWMQVHAKGLAKELEHRSDRALSKGNRWGLGLLAFQAVGREGLETMVFTLAIIFASDRQAATPVHGNLLLIGAALGLALALGVAFAIFKLGAKLNLKKFFRALGILLMIFAAGLLADAVENMQQLHWLRFGGRVIWNTSGTVSEGSSFGDVLHSLLGYADRPTELQAFVWLLYVVVSTIAFVRIGQRGGRRKKGHEHSHQVESASAQPRAASPDDETIVP